MTDNPYAAPQSSVERPIEAPEQVLKDIRNAWIAGLISGLITLAITVYAVYGGAVAGIDGWNMIDVALIFGLTFGIYLKSRFCAVAMLVYFSLSKILMWVDAGAPQGIFLAIIFFYYYWKGAVATFAYRKLATSAG